MHFIHISKVRSDFMIRYDKLFKLFEENGISSYVAQKNNIIAQSTLNRIKNGTGGLDYRTIDRICRALHCQPADIMEYVPDEQVEVVAS